MDNPTTTSLSAMKYEVVVQEDGRISLNVPFSPGKRVVVFVVQEQDAEDSYTDLVNASESSLAFWDNPYDDEDWNDA